MTPTKPVIETTGRTSVLPRRWRRSVRLNLEQLEPHEAAGSLLNPLLPDPFLGLIDLPSMGTSAAKPEAIHEPADRTQTRHDSLLDPHPLGTEQSAAHSGQATDPARVTIASRPGFDESSYGVLVRPAVHGTASRTLTPVQTLATVLTAPPSRHGSPSMIEQSTQSLSLGLRIANADIELIEEIENESPVAVDDAVTVAEDDSVVFDPTLNDTDPDTGDKLWVKSVDGETAYGRTFWEEGGLIRYIPNPNYQNTSGYYGYTKDTFTYTVTDGVDESTGTVSVTVTSVNDGPIAATDVGVFTNPALQYPQAYPGPELTYTPNGLRSMYANDRDYDSFVGLTVGQTKMADENGKATEGSVVIATDGTFKWSGPKTFSGETAFQYCAKDNEGGQSEWVTVKLILNAPGANDPAVDAVPDILPVGDGPDQGNVMTGAGGKDAGSFVILDTQPNGGD